MKPTLIIIRGNSGSGKTVLANQLQRSFGNDDCLLLHQDAIRREILHANDRPGTPAVSMLKTLIEYGYNKFPITIIEGILRRDVYGDMLNRAAELFGSGSLIYYLDVSFATTVINDSKKETPFGAKLLKDWWREKDYLNQDDRILSHGSTDYFYGKILNDIRDVSDILN